MNLSNYVTYEGHLECATKGVESAKLCLRGYEEAGEKNFIMEAIDPDHPVVLLDTSEVSSS